MCLTWQQRYGIATMLATNTLEATIARLTGNDQAIIFAMQINRHFRRRDGFIPKAVITLLNNGEKLRSNLESM